MSDSILKIIKESEGIQLPFQQFIHSFVSGDDSGDRIRIRYFKSDEKGVLFAEVMFGPKAEGPPGHVHGGAQAAVLDEICGGNLWVWGYPVVAAKLETEFIRMIPLNQRLYMKSWITEDSGRKIMTAGVICDANEEVFARARVLFVTISAEKLHTLRSN